MQLASGKKIYFASDLHLGVPNREASLKRERHFVKWLDEVKEDAEEIFIVGDLFDFWFEYSKAVPRALYGYWANWPNLPIQGSRFT